MKLFNKNNNKKDTQRKGAKEGQKVYTYYTASKKQLDQFERSNNTRTVSNTSKLTAIRGVAYKAFVAFLAVLIIGATVAITAEPKITIEGPAYNAEDYYKTKVRNAIGDSLNNKFKPFINTTEIEAEINDELPESDSVSVSVSPIGRGVKVNITTQEPFAVLIQDEAPSYIVDNSGKLVANASVSVIETAKLSNIKNESGISYKLGDQLFKPQEMEAVNELHYQYTHEDTGKVINYVLPQSLRELDVKEDKFVTRYGLDDSSGADTTQQYGAYVAIKKQLAKQGSVPKQYIDVRLGDKVFVK